MERKRILELAVEALQQQRAGIDAEIEIIQAELSGTGFRAVRRRPVAVTTRGKRSRTPAERKAQAKRMREYWAAKKAKTVKASITAKTPTASAKVRTKTEAEKKALSLKMKEAWKKRKADTAAKKAKAIPKVVKTPKNFPKT